MVVLQPNETGSESKEVNLNPTLEKFYTMDVELLLKEIMSMDVSLLELLKFNINELFYQKATNGLLYARPDKDKLAIATRIFKLRAEQDATCDPSRTTALIELDERLVNWARNVLPALHPQILDERMKAAHGGKLPEPGKPNFGAMGKDYPKPFVATMNKNEQASTTNTANTANTASGDSPAPVLSRSGSFGK
jgi:hypothetical protein